MHPLGVINRILLLVFILFVSVTCQKKKNTVTFGSVSGRAINGRTGVILSGVTITALGPTNATATTDTDGNFSISGLEATNHTLQATLDGYDSQSLEIVVPQDTTLADTNYVLFPTGYADEKIVIILTWGESPYDLDSHLYVPNGSPFYEISYTDLGNSALTADPFASLDLDDTDGTGPETTTIKMAATGTYYAGTYRFFVHNYSQDVDLTASQAIVRVYVDGVLTQTYAVPTSGTGIYWHVFDLNGSTFTPVNALTDLQTDTP
jgi:hypothetical protein